MFIWENFMHVIFSLFSLSLLIPRPLFRCVTWIESTFSLECCRQSVSGWVLPCRELIDKTPFVWQLQTFICIYWKSKFFWEVCSFICFVAARVYTHTHFSTTLNTNTSCIWSLCFLFPRWGCQRWGNDALTNKSITSMNVGMQHIAIKAPFEMQLVSCAFYTIIIWGFFSFFFCSAAVGGRYFVDQQQWMSLSETDASNHTNHTTWSVIFIHIFCLLCHATRRWLKVTQWLEAESTEKFLPGKKN